MDEFDLLMTKVTELQSMLNKLNGDGIPSKDSNPEVNELEKKIEEAQKLIRVCKKDSKKEKKWPYVLLLTALGIGGGYISTKYITNHTSTLQRQLMEKNSGLEKSLTDIKNNVENINNTGNSVSAAQLNDEIKLQEKIKGRLYDEETGRLYEEKTVGVLYQNEGK